MDIELLIKNFKRNRIKVTLLENKDSLIDYLSYKIVPNSTIGVGDSVTLDQLGVYDFLRNGDLDFLDKYKEGLSRDEKRTIYLKNFDADIFLSGVNAISSEGKIYNLDGNGSRVAPIIYGPHKVFLISGTNKIVSNENEALARIRNIAAPMDNIRLGKKNPCTKKGYCTDCRSKTKICNYHTVIQGQFDEDRIELILIEGDYGY